MLENAHTAHRPLTVGLYYSGVVLETCLDMEVSRPRVRAVSQFPPETRVEFPRSLREEFPIGTRFVATVKVAQKHLTNGRPKGPPYLIASKDTIAVIRSSVSDFGLRANLQTGTVSGRAYHYVWDNFSEA
jgi:hypothetical protein